jgi:hypothetical protein
LSWSWDESATVADLVGGAGGVGTLSAESTASWLMTLRKNFFEVERDTEEALENRRELVKLLVEKLTVSRGEDGRAKANITYQLGPPPAEEIGAESAYGVQNSTM